MITGVGSALPVETTVTVGSSISAIGRLDGVSDSSG
jgi:hypothetical protein